MYLKSVAVVVLCTLFVLGVVVVLNYEATTVNSQLQSLPSSPSSCSASEASCPGFAIVSASLDTMNTTDQLGIANPVYLSMDLNISANTPFTKIELFVGNVSAGTVPGQFQIGLNKIVDLTLPATVSASPGKAYLLSVVAFNSGGYTLKSLYVIDQIRGPPAS